MLCAGNSARPFRGVGTESAAAYLDLAAERRALAAQCFLKSLQHAQILLQAGTCDKRPLAPVGSHLTVPCKQLRRLAYRDPAYRIG